jgi:hypothetical protein
MKEKQLSKSLVASMRCDSRSVVELARFFEQKGYRADVLGSLLRQAVEALATQVRATFPDLACETHLEAYQELTKRGLIHEKSRGHADLLEEISLERLTMVSEGASTQIVSNIDPGIDPELVEQAKQKLLQQQDDDGEFDLEALRVGIPIIQKEGEDEGMDES